MTSQQSHNLECQEVDILMTKSSNKFNFGRCRVCQDRATGIHYGIPSCEGCKGFYKRSIGKYDKYACSFASKCMITPRQRRKCKLCRWKSCVQAGMSFDKIKMGRISKVQKEKVKSLIDYGPSTVASIVSETNTITTLTTPTTKTVATKGIQTISASTSSFDRSTTLILNDICTSMYVEFMRDLIPLIERAHLCLKHNHPPPLSTEQLLDPHLIHLVWQQSMQKMSDLAKTVVFYIKKLPGFAQLDVTDLATLLTEHTTTLIPLKLNRTYIEGEQFFMIMQNIRITPALISRIMGQTMFERIDEFNDRLRALDLRDSEMALLMPFIMSSPSENMLFKNPDLVQELNENYKRVLLNEFDMNKRSHAFIEELVDTLKSVPFR